MPGAEVVVGAFVHAGKSADASGLAEGLERFAAAGKYLVGIGLMAYVEYDLVFRSVVHIVHADYEFDGAETRTEVARILGAASYYVITEFGAQGSELLHIKTADIRR